MTRKQIQSPYEDILRKLDQNPSQSTGNLPQSPRTRGNVMSPRKSKGDIPRLFGSMFAVMFFGSRE
jgi:hypothetical protein